MIKKFILKDYKYLRNSISILTSGEPIYNTILTGLAMGDRRTNSAFKRSKINFDNGIDVVDKLCDAGVLKLEKSLQNLTNLTEHYTVSEKLLFTAPFLRFWFAFVSPIFQGIKDGDFDEFYKRFDSRKTEFTNLVFEQLSHEFIKESFVDDKIYQLGRYWDDETDIELLGKTKSGKIIVGSCKYTNSKIKKSELTKLKEKCEKLKIKADIFVMFSKKGFSNELKSLKNDTLRLYTAKSFKFLI